MISEESFYVGDGRDGTRSVRQSVGRTVEDQPSCGQDEQMVGVRDGLIDDMGTEQYGRRSTDLLQTITDPHAMQRGESCHRLIQQQD